MNPVNSDRLIPVRSMSRYFLDMGKNPDRLTREQFAVLKWIGEGSPGGVYTGYEHKIVARSLLRRGLVTITGKGPTWAAHITPKGLDWIDHLPVPDVVPAATEGDELYALVDAGGGRLEVSGTPTELRELGAAVRMHLNSPNRPRGKALALEPFRREHPYRVVHIVDRLEDFVERKPVPVVRAVKRWDPIVKVYRAKVDWQFVTKPYLNRACLLLESFVREARQRGLVPSTPRPESRRDVMNKRHVVLSTAVGDFTIEVREISMPYAKPLSPKDRYRSTLPEWRKQRLKEFESTGNLEILLRGPCIPLEGRRFDDVASKRVEEKLPDIFCSIEVAVLTRQRQIAEFDARKALEEIEAQRRIDRKKRAFSAQRRWDHMLRLNQAWREAAEIRRFLDAAASAAEAFNETDRSLAEAFIAEMRQRIEAADPLRPENFLQSDYEPTESDLHNFKPERDLGIRKWPS